MSLWQLAVSQVATVKNIAGLDVDIQARLRELGLRPGATVTCLQHSPLGGPRVYQLSHGRFAIDRDIAKQIEVHTGEELS